MLLKLTAVKKFGRLVREEDDDRRSRRGRSGRCPRFPDRTLAVMRSTTPGAAPPRPRGAGRLRRSTASGRAHAGAPPVEGMPGDLRRDCPAVIAGRPPAGSSSARSKTPTFRPSRRTVIRFAVSKTSWRLWEMITTASPCSPRRAHEREHLLGLRDPERRGRLVEDHELGVPLHGLRDGDRLALAAGERRDRLADRPDRRDGERLQRRGRVLLPSSASSRTCQRLRLAAEVHVLDDVEVVAESEILVDDLDPEPRGVLRPVDVDLLALEEDLAAVGGMDAGDALDQRRLAGAVVADERHHLAARAPRSRRR